jgi:uncharacterized caspase-like protein
MIEPVKRHLVVAMECLAFLFRRRAPVLRALHVLLILGVTKVPCGAILAPHAAVAMPNPTLGRQVLVPSLAKDDWHRSAFSNDGTLLLVVDSARSFILHVTTGRELRPVLLEPREHLSWARAKPNSERWIAYTNEGYFVEVDAATGIARRIQDAKPSIGRAEYGDRAGGEVSFEFTADREVVALAVIGRERPNEGGHYRWDERTLFKLNVETGVISASRRLTAEEFFVNSGGRVAVNKASGLAITYDPTYTGNIALWRIPRSGAAAAKEFSHVCSLSLPTNPFDIHPEGASFALFFTDHISLINLVPRLSKDCQPQSARSSTRRLTRKEFCKPRGSVEGEKVVAAKPGASIGDFIQVTSNLELFRIRPSLGRCVVRSRWTTVDQHFQPWRLAREWGTTTDREAKSDLFVISPRALNKQRFVIAGGTLNSVPEAGGPASEIVSLVGKLGGVVELEAARGLLVGSPLLAPLKTFDSATLSMNTIGYDYATRYRQTSFLFQKPFAIVPSLKAVVIINLDGVLRFRPIGSELTEHVLPPDRNYNIVESVALCASDDARRIYVTTTPGELVLLTRADLHQQFKLAIRLLLDEKVGYLFKIACTDAGTVIVADSLTDKVFVVTATADSLKLLQVMEDEEESSRLLARPSLTRDGLLLAVGPSLYARASTTEPFVRIHRFPNTERISFEEGGNRFFTFGMSSALHSLRRAGANVGVDVIRSDFGAATDGVFLDGDFAVFVRNAEDLEVVDLQTAKVIGRLSFGSGQNWLYTDGAGRFDAADLEHNDSAHWLMPDDPLRPLRPEIFMRDYFEPRLLPRLLECHKAERSRPDACAKEFKPVRPLATLNRTQPEARILSVAPEPGATDEVSVTVEVGGVEGRFGIAGQERAWRSGVYDLRLFRDGQLVGQAPDLKEPEPLEALDAEADVARWREAHRLVEGIGRKELTFRHVRLPKREVGSKIEFSAYAFNADRVKSATASMPYTVPQSIPARDRRAYVVAVGVSAYEDPAWDLRYADDDARRLVEVLEPRLRATGQYKEVVSVPLLADWAERDGVRTVTAAAATKANVKAVLDILAGREVPEQVRRALPNGMKLERAGPDDLVLISYSSHGYADRAGNFYLFPYDIGSNTGKTVSAEILKRAISSAELSAWLRDVDAGELIMVVDACHSAASVESPEFKPGPMGSRGLGQLAYDKGMRILASTRADDVAWESARTQQGLLSYALVHDGLEEGKADFRPADGRIGVQEWLEYAAQRVPQLYAEAMTTPRGGGTPNAAASSTDANEQGRLVAFDSLTRNPRYITRPNASPQTQQPSLFNYKRGDDPLLATR